MQRYLIRFSYSGSKLNGAQKQQNRIPPHLWTRPWVSEDRKTVQGALETFLVRMKPVNEPKVFLTSRTDVGVHALSTTAGVDLQKSDVCNDVFFNPKHITLRLNDYLARSGIDIRIQKTLAVPGNFDPRKSVTSRTYMYKFAVRKKPEDIPTTRWKDFTHEWKPGEIEWAAWRNMQRQKCLSALPLSELDYTTEIKAPLDIDLIQEVLQLFVGEVNLSAFASKRISTPKAKMSNGEKERISMKPGYFIRQIDDFSLYVISPPLPVAFEPIYELYDFYAVKITSKSFFTHQIRRMMWLVFEVARGKLKMSQVHDLLDNPIREKWPNLGLAPPDGLSLASVEYDPADLVEATDDISKLPVGPPPDFELMNVTKIDWSHSGAILKATEPLLGYRWFDPKLYLTKEELEALHFPRREKSVE